MILRYTYDNMERQLTTTVERDGAEPVLLCCNTYDDLGRLVTQSCGHSITDFIQYIQSLPAGKYKVVNGKIVSQ